MTFYFIDAFYDNFAFFRQRGQDLSFFAFILAGQDLNGIAFFNMQLYSSTHVLRTPPNVLF